MPTLSVRAIKKPRRSRLCADCRRCIRRGTPAIRLYGMADHGDKPYGLYFHPNCLEPGKDPRVTAAKEKLEALPA